MHYVPTGLSGRIAGNFQRSPAYDRAQAAARDLYRSLAPTQGSMSALRTVTAAFLVNFNRLTPAEGGGVNNLESMYNAWLRDIRPRMLGFDPSMSADSLIAMALFNRVV